MTATIKEREILVCQGHHCEERGSRSIYELFTQSLEAYHLKEKVKILSVACQKFCKVGPLVIIKPDNVLYVKLNKKAVDKIIQEHILKDKVLNEFLFKDPKTGAVYANSEEAKASLKGKKVEVKSLKYQIKNTTTEPKVEKQQGKNKQKLKEQQKRLKEQKKAEFKALKAQLKEKYKRELKEKKAQSKEKLRLQKEKMKSNSYRSV